MKHTTVSEHEPVLKVEGLHKHFTLGGQTIPVLQDLNLTLAAGEKLAILGPSGSGKSTLLGLLAGLESPDAGRILMGKQALHELDQAELTRYRARYLGIVFQQFHLMRYLSALENVMLPLDITDTASGFRERRERARHLLVQVGLEKRMDHFPHQLSGGERQRVAMARALSTEPPLILADEPSGNLDLDTGERVMQVLFEVLQDHGSSLILVTHNPEQAQHCDRQLRLHQGQLQPL